jgi:CHAD domain-containing protein
MTTENGTAPQRGIKRTSRARKPTLENGTELQEFAPEVVENQIIIIEEIAPETIPTEVPEPEEVSMTANAPLSEAGRGIMRDFLKKLLENEPIAREGSDPEGVHDMRVATRRLRAAFQVMEETVWQPKVCRKFRRDLRGLANALSMVRDSDVYLQHLDEYLAKQEPETVTELSVLREAVAKRRDKGREEMHETLDSKKMRRVLDKLEGFLNTPGAGVAESAADDHEAAPSLVRHFAGSAVWRRYEELQAYETVLPADILTLHRLRVAAKRLRYTLGFFEEALTPEAKALSRQLSQLQDYLGDLHDHQVAVELATSLLKKYPENSALPPYREERILEIARMTEGFGLEWDKVSGPDFRTRLANSLAGM